MPILTMVAAATVVLEPHTLLVLRRVVGAEKPLLGMVGRLVQVNLYRVAQPLHYFAVAPENAPLRVTIHKEGEPDLEFGVETRKNSLILIVS